MRAGRAWFSALTAFAVLFSLGFASAATAAPKKPKLKVQSVSNPPANAAPGDVFSVSGNVRNIGKKGGTALVTATLSETSGRSPGSISLGNTTTAKVKAGEIAPYVISGAIPGDTADGTYYVVACAQTDGAGKSRCRSSANTVTVDSPDPPDPVFEPGARTLGDDLFPQTGNGGYEVSNYDIDLRYSGPTTNEFLPGTKTTITAEATQNLSEFTLDFQDIPVSAVTVNGVAAESFDQVDAEPEFAPGSGATQPMKLVVDPAGPGILDGDQMEVVVEYAGTPVLVVDADESFEGWIPACYPLDPPQTCDGAFVVGEPIGSQGWFPSNNFPTDKATFDTSITVPTDLEAVGIGELVANGNNGNGTETWSWSEDDPTSTYLTTATVGNFDYTKRDITESLTGKVLPQYEFIDSSATPAEKTAINTALGRTEAMTNFLSARFGPYPYDSGGAVADKAAGVGYALEVATKSHYAGNFTTGAPGIGQSTLVHEISHQWMGNAVTLENWKDIWFQEGWAQYASWSWNFEDGTSTVSPAGQFQTNYASGPATKWDTIPTELNNDPADLFATFPTYTRGAMTYEGYRQIVGTPKFYDFARELQSRFAYDNVSSEDVVDLMLETSEFTGSDLELLEDYFDQWLYQAGRPTITPNDFTR